MSDTTLVTEDKRHSDRAPAISSKSTGCASSVRTAADSVTAANSLASSLDGPAAESIISCHAKIRNRADRNDVRRALKLSLDMEHRSGLRAATGWKTVQVPEVESHLSP